MALYTDTNAKIIADTEAELEAATYLPNGVFCYAKDTESSYVKVDNVLVSTIGGAVGGVAASDITGSLSLIAQTGLLPLATGTSGTLSVLAGGTGQSNANSALNALLPSQTNNSGKFLTTDATNASWGTVVGGSPFTTVRKTGLDQGAASTSFTNSVNQMDFTLVANTNYVFEYWVRYQTAATTTGLVLGVQTPTSPIGIWWFGSTPLAATGTVTGMAGIGSNTTISIPSGAVGGVQLAYLTGMVMNGANAGTMALRWCSEVSGSLCTIKTGTMGRIMSIT